MIQFELITPLDAETIAGHVAHANGLGLPQAIGEPPTLTVIANGPSAREAPHDGVTLALNGALRVIPSPTFYAACDPQEMVADFLTAAPKGTTYFIADKCHPKVFESLKGRDVRLWHVSDKVELAGVPASPSITLTALCLFARMGWRKFNVYGWDACFGPKGEHHASEQPFVGEVVTVEFDGKSYQSTPTWAAEAEHALYVLQLLEYLGVEVNIMGDSMVKAIREYRMAA